MNKPKILVTGGVGYIGSHTTVALIEAGFEVIVADNLSNADLLTLEGIRQITGVSPIFEQVDFCDKNQTSTLFANYPTIKGVIHFAAFKAVGESVQNPLKYYQNNLISLMYLLENMLHYHIPYLVFSSSCTVYGEPQELPVTENSSIPKAQSPYGNTKQIGEEIIQDVCKAYPFLNAIALRYFNPIGAHDSALIGELPLGSPNNLMPYITQTAIGLREKLEVFGDDYDTPDGSCIRDYIHVMDVAQAHILALEYLLNQKNKQSFEYFNLGTGKGHSVFEVIQSFERASAQKLPYRVVERRKGDVTQVYADTTLAKKILGWEAKRGLDNMTATAWKWEQYYRHHLQKK